MVLMLLLLLPPLSSRVPLLVSVRGTGEGDGEGSSQRLGGRVGEVEQRAGGHHPVIGVASRPGGGQKNGVHRLDLREDQETSVLLVTQQVGRR